MPFDDVDPGNGHLVALRIDGNHFTDQAAIFTADHLDAITLADVQTAVPLVRVLFGHDSKHLRCQRDDPHEALFAQLPADRAENAGAAWLAIVSQDHRGILIELDVGPIGAAMLLRGTYDHRLDDLALLDVAARDGVFDRSDNDVADARIPATGSTEHTDAQDLLGARIVGDLEPRLLLDHLCSFSPQTFPEISSAGALLSSDKSV